MPANRPVMILCEIYLTTEHCAYIFSRHKQRQQSRACSTILTFKSQAIQPDSARRTIMNWHQFADCNLARIGGDSQVGWGEDDCTDSRIAAVFHFFITRHSNATHRVRLSFSGEVFAFCMSLRDAVASQWPRKFNLSCIQSSRRHNVTCLFIIIYVLSLRSYALAGSCFSSHSPSNNRNFTEIFHLNGVQAPHTKSLKETAAEL
jgi:hypothetical protein